MTIRFAQCVFTRLQIASRSISRCSCSTNSHSAPAIDCFGVARYSTTFERLKSKLNGKAPTKIDTEFHAVGHLLGSIVLECKTKQNKHKYSVTNPSRRYFHKRKQGEKETEIHTHVDARSRQCIHIVSPTACERSLQKNASVLAVRLYQYV